MAKQRHRELIEAKRTAQLKHKFEEDRVRAERVYAHALDEPVLHFPLDPIHFRPPAHAVLAPNDCRHISHCAQSTTPFPWTEEGTGEKGGQVEPNDVDMLQEMMLLSQQNEEAEEQQRRRMEAIYQSAWFHLVFARHPARC